MHRYPINRTRYCQCVGRVLEHRIGQVFEELGFRSWIAKKQSNGVDLEIYDDKDRLVLVAEILNWSLRSELPDKRKTRIVSNLLEYDCNKLLIYSVLANEAVLNDVDEHGISILKIGFQILPKQFYDHFSKRDQVISRRIDSKKTKNLLKSKIAEYMQSISPETMAPISKTPNTIITEENVKQFLTRQD